MGKHIKIYTTNTCAYCDAVKKFLDSKDMKYDLVNLDDDPAKIEEFKKLTDLMVVPVVAVTDDAAPDEPPRVVQGWNPTKLAEAIA